jgi:hypothetical protein
LSVLLIAKPSLKIAPYAALPCSFISSSAGEVFSIFNKQFAREVGRI